MNNSRKSMLVTMVVSGALLAAHAASAPQELAQEPTGSTAPSGSAAVSSRAARVAASMPAAVGVEEGHRFGARGSLVAQAACAAGISWGGAADINVAGVVFIEDMVNRLPQANGETGSR